MRHSAIRLRCYRLASLFKHRVNNATHMLRMNSFSGLPLCRSSPKPTTSIGWVFPNTQQQQFHIDTSLVQIFSTKSRWL